MEENTMINYIMLYKVEKKFDIKQWFLVTDMPKTLAKNLIAKKSKMFSRDQVKEIMLACDGGDKLQQRLMGVGVQPVSYNLPEYMNKGMHFCLGELKVPKGRLLENMNSCSRQRVQNMSKSVLSKWPKLATEMLAFNEKGFTCTAWHRSGATALADGSAGVINFKHAGGWKSNTVDPLEGPAMKKAKTGTGDKPAAAVAMCLVTAMWVFLSLVEYLMGW
eukprot:15350326-Ditylum_brightwellii.AAC.1